MEMLYELTWTLKTQSFIWSDGDSLFYNENKAYFKDNGTVVVSIHICLFSQNSGELRQ